MNSFKRSFLLSLILLSMLFLPGCDLVVGIFEVGLWAGIIISAIVVILVIVIIVQIFKRLGRR
ncbi:MAG: hypothetical protein ACOC11_02650 [Prolixibacteraceae bacterium]